MARKGSVGEIKVWYVPTIANRAAPTTAELTAGTDLTPFLRRDGLQTPNPGTTIDASDVSSLQNKNLPGSYGGDNVTIQAYRDDTTDTAWTTLTRGASGYIVVRRFGGSTVAAASANKVEVYPGAVISREPSASGDNEAQRFTVTWAVSDTVVDGVVA